jgi:solute carrier family 35 protein F5
MERVAPVKEEKQSLSSAIEPSDTLESEANDDNNLMMSHWGHIRAATVLCPIWFLANFSYNYSLSLTSNTSSTIISTTSCLFTFILSVLFKAEKFSFDKLAGVVFCIVGSSCVALNDRNLDSDGHSQTESLVGDCLAFFAAVMYGVYTATIKVFCPADNKSSMMLLFGYLGLLNAIFLTPIVLAFCFTNFIDIKSLTYFIFLMLVVKGLFDNVLSDYLWARACLLTSPTVATVGLSLTVPLAFVSDLIVHEIKPTGLQCFGAILVLLGFVLINGVAQYARNTSVRYRSRRFSESVSYA